MNLNSELKQILDDEQAKVIESDDKRILVSAGPGSGKTFTLVRKIKRDLEKLKPWEGIVACSFTKEASTQLKNKLAKEAELETSFIGTIDAFVLSEIFYPYKNRFLNLLGSDKRYNKLKIKFPKHQSLSAEVTRTGRSSSNYKSCIKTWIDDFKEGTYEISFVPYLASIHLFEKILEAKEYFQNKYKIIYVDEAQDLNSFQIEFIKYLCENMGIGCVLVGDKNQSIYAFRGAKPEEFYQLRNNGFTEYKITVSVRCHLSILNFANLFIGERIFNTPNIENRVHMGFDFKKASFNSLDGSFFVLFETNDDAKKCYDHLMRNEVVRGPLVYSRSIKIVDEEFNSYYFEIIEEILKFYYNYDNGDRSLIYQLDDYKTFLSNYLDEKKLKDNLLLDIKEDACDYLFSILDLFDAYYDEAIVSNIKCELCDECVVNHYKRIANCNRIMTIHSSKGLEADNVIVRINKDPYRFDDEYKRKMFVAFTRAKNELFISAGVSSQSTVMRYICGLLRETAMN